MNKKLIIFFILLILIILLIKIIFKDNENFYNNNVFVCNSGITCDTNKNHILFSGRDLNFPNSRFLTITIGNHTQKIHTGGLQNSKITTLKFSPNSIITHIMNNALKNSNIKNIEKLPPSLQIVGKQAFMNSSKLVSIDLSKTNVNNIDDECFFNCTNLKEILLPNNVRRLGKKVCMNCKNLTSITIPNSVTNIDSSAFENCTNLKKIILNKTDNSMLHISNRAFAKTPNLEQITRSMDNISYNSFSDNIFVKNDTLLQSRISNVIKNSHISYNDNLLVNNVSKDHLNGEYEFTGIDPFTHFPVYEKVNNSNIIIAKLFVENRFYVIKEILDINNHDSQDNVEQMKIPDDILIEVNNNKNGQPPNVSMGKWNSVTNGKSNISILPLGIQTIIEIN
tara:strand:+ start:99 stop:1283 length:1185 start_codon:yes stop_codon:yes gene_type:complete